MCSLLSRGRFASSRRNISFTATRFWTDFWRTCVHCTAFIEHGLCRSVLSHHERRCSLPSVLHNTAVVYGLVWYARSVKVARLRHCFAKHCPRSSKLVHAHRIPCSIKSCGTLGLDVHKCRRLTGSLGDRKNWSWD